MEYVDCWAVCPNWCKLQQSIIAYYATRVQLLSAALTLQHRSHWAHGPEIPELPQFKLKTVLNGNKRWIPPVLGQWIVLS